MMWPGSIRRPVGPAWAPAVSGPEKTEGQWSADQAGVRPRASIRSVMKAATSRSVMPVRTWAVT